MTPAQFTAAAQLLQLRHGPAQEAARLVLVDNYRQVDAAAATGLSVASVSNAVTRIRRGLDLARLATA